MEEFDFNADANAEAGDYSPCPDGVYVLRVEKAKGETTSTRKPMIKLVLVVDEGPYMGRKVWTNVVFNPKGENGHGLTVQALHAFGFEYDGDMKIVVKDWEGRTCRAKLASEQYKKELKSGQVVDRWKNVIPTAGFITPESEARAAEAAAPAAAAPAPAQAAAPKQAVGAGTTRRAF